MCCARQLMRLGCRHDDGVCRRCCRWGSCAAQWVPAAGGSRVDRCGNGYRVRRRRVGNRRRRQLRRRAAVDDRDRGVLQVRAPGGHCPLAARHRDDRGRRLGRVPAVMGQGLLRAVPGAVDRCGQRRADQRDRARHQQLDGWRDPAIVGRCHPQLHRLRVRAHRRLQRVRPVDAHTGRRDGIQHPALRHSHVRQSRPGAARPADSSDPDG